MAGDIASSSWTEQWLPPPSGISGYRRILKMLVVTLQWTGIQAWGNRNAPSRFSATETADTCEGLMDHSVQMQTLPTFLIGKVLGRPVQTRQIELTVTQCQCLRTILYYNDAGYKNSNNNKIKQKHQLTSMIS